MDAQNKLKALLRVHDMPIVGTSSLLIGYHVTVLALASLTLVEHRQISSHSWQAYCTFTLNPTHHHEWRSQVVDLWLHTNQVHCSSQLLKFCALIQQEPLH